MNPFTYWLILKGQVAASTLTRKLDVKNLPFPHMPVAFGWKSTTRCLVELYCGDEPLQNRSGDGEAMFGTRGNTVKVPKEAQVVYPGRRDWRIDVENLDTENASDVCLAILCKHYVGMKQPAGMAKAPALHWLNLYGTVDANSSAALSDDIDFPFEPVAVGYESTGRAECILYADQAPFSNQAGDLAAMFGDDGRVVPIPPGSRKNHVGKTSFRADVADLSGSENVVTISILGQQYRG